VTGTTNWHILTTEYPPDPGGVADYTRLLACAFAARGHRVHVWAPSSNRGEFQDGQVVVHRIPGFTGEGLRELDQGLRASGPQARLFVQYVPTAFGLRGMNVPLIRWLRSRAEEIWVQFHEITLGWHLWRRPDLHLVHAVQVLMADALARRADRIFIAIEGWRARLGGLGARATWLPVPSNLPVSVEPSEQVAAREALGPGLLVSHFGTYSRAIVPDLLLAIRAIAGELTDVRFQLLGRGAQRVQDQLPRDRVIATGELPAREVATRLSISDLALQPFPDGISARRGSAMAALALGVPVVTTIGFLTDPVFREGGVALAPVGAPGALARAAVGLLQDRERRHEQGRRGAALYRCCFSLERTCEVLLGP
jgi:glycosyltransferase involved in cell wall biosynthesis